MNHRQQQSTMSLSRPLTEGVAAGVFEALRMVQVATADLWRRRRVRHDEWRAFDSVAHLGEHVLKDIGAPHWLIAQAAERDDVRHRPWVESEFR